MFKHAFEVWDVLTRVPLIIKAPGAEPKRIAEPRTHIDLAPTIVELMRVDAAPGFQGKSLVPELYGEEKPKSREPLLLELAEDSNNPARRAIVEGDYKLILFDSGRQALFNLKSDPAELKDLAKDEPEKTKELFEKMQAAFDKLPVVKPFGGNKLRSGKIATGPKGPPKEEAEKDASAPKDSAAKKSE
jgi:choline-sulfatase